MLNSFWGKFGMRDNLNQTEFIYSPKKYFDLVRSKSKKIHDVDIVTDDCVMLTCSKEEKYNEANGSSNLAIAALTTSYVRLLLLTCSDSWKTEFPTLTRTLLSMLASLDNGSPPLETS